MAVDPSGPITRGFLFADLRGYTDFVERHCAEAAATLLTRYRALTREAIGRFGGAEVKTEGDSFVVFDSVSSAVRCGLAITSDARASADEPIPVGVGIHAGETIETDGGYVGSPVNIAARICAQCNAAVGTYGGLASIPPPRADFVDAYRAAFGEEPTDYAAATYACAQVILASLEAVATDGPVCGWPQGGPPRKCRRSRASIRDGYRHRGLRRQRRLDEADGVVLPRRPGSGRWRGRVGSHQAARLRSVLAR